MLKNKITIVFLINDMFINNFETLYNKMLKNDIFEVFHVNQNLQTIKSLYLQRIYVNF